MINCTGVTHKVCVQLNCPAQPHAVVYKPAVLLVKGMTGQHCSVAAQDRTALQHWTALQHYSYRAKMAGVG